MPGLTLFIYKEAYCKIITPKRLPINLSFYNYLFKT